MRILFEVFPRKQEARLPKLAGFLPFFKSELSQPSSPVAAATAVKAPSATAVKAAPSATVKASASMETSAIEAMSHAPTSMESAGRRMPRAAISVADITVSAVITSVPPAEAIPATPVTPAAAAPATSPSPVIPGAGADEDSTDKPVRAVVAIRRAVVGIVRIVPPCAFWWTVVVGSGNHRRSDSDSHGDLGLRRRNNRKGKHCNHCQQHQAISPHDTLHVPPDFRSGAGVTPGLRHCPSRSVLVAAGFQYFEHHSIHLVAVRP